MFPRVFRFHKEETFFFPPRKLIDPDRYDRKGKTYIREKKNVRDKERKREGEVCVVYFKSGSSGFF